MTEPERHGWSRRSMLRGGAVVGVAAGAGVGGFVLGRRTGTGPGEPMPPTTLVDHVPATGEHQAGVARPDQPQPNGRFTSYDADVDSRYEVRELLAALGTTIATLTAPGATVTGVTDDGAGDLTITVGVGPRLVAMAGADLPGADPLPRFDRDGDLPERDRGGDLLLAVQASDAVVVENVGNHLVLLSGQLSVRWAQRGFRGGGNGQAGVARNVVGYLDGIVVPRTSEELDANVWIPSGPAKGGTICVLRRLVVDVSRFAAETPERQDAIIGRHQSDGSPLSGGGPMDKVDPTAKTPEGQYLTPAHAHARAAHPSFTGSPTMLRGSYTFDNGPSDRGTIFRCFQPDLDVFVKTQRRLDEVDDLMGYVRATSSGSFLIVPGYQDGADLGSAVFG